MDRTEKRSSDHIARRVRQKEFNPSAVIPYGLTIGDLCRSMNEYIEFLSFINIQLETKKIPHLECFLMPANFSSIVGEFMTATIPKFCKTLVKNTYHNGHPDLLPIDQYKDNSALHAKEGIEVKASRYTKGWQGHNPENAWLMVFCFEANRIQDKEKGISPMPFRFTKVVGAKLLKKDWLFSGRSATSRRTITASVTKSGFDKMEKNWIYRSPNDAD
jgi:hypothetical protein